MGIDGTVFLVAIPLFLSLVAIEFLVFRHLGRRGYTTRQSLASIGVFAGYKIVGGAKIMSFGALSLWVWSHRIAEVPLNTFAGLAALFIAVEFSYYWQHRCAHLVRFMWASHAVHHSPEELNVLASFRLAWTGILSGSILFYLPLVLIGFHPAAIAAMYGANLVYQSWVHTTLVPRLGIIEYVFNTPSAHRVHHACNDVYIDRNFGGVTVIFDRLFGTYLVERAEEPCRYGLAQKMESWNPVWIAFHEWVAMGRDLLRSRGVSDVLGYVFGRPGWRPEARSTSPALHSTPAE